MKRNAPIRLMPARAWRTYLGGREIDALHGMAYCVDSQFPEEWIMSVVAARNSGREAYPNEGLSFLADSPLSLKECIAADAEAMLGAAHLGCVGESTGVLVKLIDAGERLTIQAHPDKETAMRLFHSPFGKTECWHILGGREVDGAAPCIYMGFRSGVTREMWQDVFERQDIEAMLGCLHRFEVQSGDTYLIQGGVPHAIGAGCLLLEIQEPTDYTIRTERVTPAGLKITDFMCHQGLGFEKMFDCFHYEGLLAEQAQRRWKLPPRALEQSPAYTRSEVVGYGDTPCFCLERLEVFSQCELSPDDRYCGLYIWAGAGELADANGAHGLARGDQFFVPAASEPFTLRAMDAPLVVFRFFGPKLSSEGK